MKAYDERQMALALAMFMAASVGSVGCNTFRGAGQDISAGGRGIERAADGSRRRDTHREVHHHTIRATSDQYGSIRTSGDIYVAFRTEQTFRIGANRGYHVTDVLVDGRSIGPVTQSTFRDVAANHSIDVLFDPNRRR
jgi:predicted small secreted protein